MENARVLEDRLRKIIREVSDSTGQEIKRDLMDNFTQAVDQNNSRELLNFLVTLNKALQEI